MRRLVSGGSTLLYESSTIVSSTTVFRPTSGITEVTSQVRHIRNLHRNKQERNKSFVKDRLHYSKKWKLVLGNNYELSEVKGHEREAFENFFRYRYDNSQIKVLKYVDNPEKLPPRERYDYYFNTIEGRKGLPAFIKCKYVLRALEAFIDMKDIKDIPPNYEKWSSREQEHFLWLVDTLVAQGKSCLSRHHSVVAMCIRASAISDEVRCYEKRDLALNAAENMANRMDIHFAHNRPIHATIDIGDWKRSMSKWENHVKSTLRLQELGKITVIDEELPKPVKKVKNKLPFPLMHYQTVHPENKRATYLNQFSKPYLSLE